MTCARSLRSLAWSRLDGDVVVGTADLVPGDVDDLDLALALRGHDLRGVADLLADQRARHRRPDRDPAALDAGLVLADDRQGLALAVVGVLDRHGGAEL